MFGKEDLSVPGTVYMVDLDGLQRVQETNTHGANVILVPQPSDDPNDPLRWLTRKKLLQFWFLFLWAFMQGVITNWTGPVFSIWMEELPCTQMQLNIARALMLLFLCMGCLFLQPLALKLGRRMVYVCCTLVQIVVCIIGSQMNSIKVFFLMQILTGIAASPGDALVEISTTDVFFQHERASKLTWFILALYGGCDLGPVAAGYIVSNLSWRWCYWIQLIIFCCMLVLQILFMEDTTFSRIDEHDTASSEEPILVETALKNNYKVSEDDVEIDRPLRTFWQRRALWESEYGDHRPYLALLLRPFLLIGFPGIIWSGLVYGAQMFWLSLLAVTQSAFYSAPPYNFSEASVGLTNVGAFVGVLIGMFYGGPFVDYLTIKLTQRNNGVMEPEFRLWAMAIPTVFNAGGLLAYGLSIYYGAHWFVSVGIGQALLGFSMSSSGGICLTYSVDSTPNLAKEALVLILVMRNLIGMGFTFAIGPWLDKCGVMETTCLMFMLSVLINAPFILFLKYGKSLRIMTKARYERYSDPHLSMAHVFR